MVDLTQEALREVVDYCPVTGVFTSRRSHGRWKAGRTLGWISGNGYCYLKVLGKERLAHRLAWLYVHGDVPQFLDHINGDPTDNRICNLRPASKKTNGANRGKQSNNTSGYKGVTRHWQKWVAQITVDGKNRYIGLYDTPQAAHQAYMVEARKHFGEFASG